MTSLDTDAATSLPSSTTVLEQHIVATPGVLNIGTRKSLLALKQTEIVVDLLKEHWPHNEYKIQAHSTTGDKNQVTALHEIGAKSLWTAELEKLLLDGEVDIIVHSLKDMPTQLPHGCTIGAITKRSDPRDALVLHPNLPAGTTLSSLPADSTIGTSSVRRSAQLKRLYPHLRFQSVRGNIGTRLRKLDESNLENAAGHGTTIGDAHTVEEDDLGPPQYSGIILAAAGLLRVGDGHRISRYLSSHNMEDVRGSDGKTTQRKGMLHAVGQGALGIEIREGDERVIELLRPIEHSQTSLACYAERSLLRTLEGGCSVPIGVETEWVGDIDDPQGRESGTLRDTISSAVSAGLEGSSNPKDRHEKLAMRAIVISLDGTEHVEVASERAIHTKFEAEEFGIDIASQLVQQGADKILEKINLNRTIIAEQGDA